MPMLERKPPKQIIRNDHMENSDSIHKKNGNGNSNSHNKAQEKSRFHENSEIMDTIRKRILQNSLQVQISTRRMPLRHQNQQTMCERKVQPR